MRNEKSDGPTRKLRLRKEVLVNLTPSELANIAGGNCTTTNCTAIISAKKTNGAAFDLAAIAGNVHAIAAFIAQ